MRRGSHVFVAVACVTLACDRAPTSPNTLDARAAGQAALAAEPAGASVTGAGTITFGESIEHITVNVVGGTGFAVFHDKAAGGYFQGKIAIDCANVVGNVATLSGVVTQSSGGFEEGTRVVFQIVDNGQGASGPDLMTSIVVDPGTACLTPIEDVFPVRGNFTVRGEG